PCRRPPCLSVDGRRAAGRPGPRPPRRRQGIRPAAAAAPRHPQGRSGDRGRRRGLRAPSHPRASRRAAVIRRLRVRLPPMPFVPLPRLAVLVGVSALPLALATLYAPIAWAALAICVIALVLAIVDARAT